MVSTATLVILVNMVILVNIVNSDDSGEFIGFGEMMIFW